MIICIDGKTMHSNKGKDTKPCHIVSTWSSEDGYCLGQQVVDEKNNEITAISEVLERTEIKGQVVMTDAMGAQPAIVETIRRRRADYVPAVKGNQGSLEADIRLYFEDSQVCEELKKGPDIRKPQKRPMARHR